MKSGVVHPFILGGCKRKFFSGWISVESLLAGVQRTVVNEVLPDTFTIVMGVLSLTPLPIPNLVTVCGIPH